MKSKEHIHTTYHLENQFIHAMFHVEQKVLSRCRPIYVGHKPVLYTLQVIHLLLPFHNKGGFKISLDEMAKVLPIQT